LGTGALPLEQRRRLFDFCRLRQRRANKSGDIVCAARIARIEISLVQRWKITNQYLDFIWLDKNANDHSTADGLILDQTASGTLNE
jgi:hypothetical protein